jgi:CBS domain-containing protein
LSFGDQKKFLSSIHPFDELSSNELDGLIKGIDILFFKMDDTIVDAKESVKHLYVIIKGEVRSQDEVGNRVMVYHQKDSFDADALISGILEYRYIACQDTIVYEIKRESFLKTFERNRAFREFYTMHIVDRIEYLKQKERRDSSGLFLTTRVKDSYIHKVSIVDSSSPLKDALQLSLELKRSEIIIKDRDSYRLLTDSDIKRLLYEGYIDMQKPLSEYKTHHLLGIDENDFLFNAYLTLIEKNIKRLAVFRENRIVGVIEQIDILSYFANRSHLVTLRIEKADSLDELKDASGGYIDMVKRLHSQGVKSRYIAKLVSEINRKLLSRLFEMILPLEYRNRCAFLVMGSEGRGEQIIKTDQDNALIVEDSLDSEKLKPYMNRFGEILIEFGYPPCKGDIMVTNPFWVDNLESYKNRVLEWKSGLEEENYIHFATLFDAVVVAGKRELLEELKRYIFSSGRNDTLYLAYFARLSLLFETPVGLFSSILRRDRFIDIKKAGIFPVVQGVRSLALKYEVEENSTVNRVKELSNRGVIDIEFAKEIVEAFEVLSYIRLSTQIEALELNREISNRVDSDSLSKIKRDLLKDALSIVERFKKFISREFGLDYLPQ